MDEEESLSKLAEQLSANLLIKDRQYRMKTYKNAFLGTDAVAFLLSMGSAKTEAEALEIGNKLMQMGFFNHVTKDHEFKNEGLFYRFTTQEDFHGG